MSASSRSTTSSRTPSSRVWSSNRKRSTSSPSSIREHGVLQPILVRPLGPNTYQIVAGERRWRASRLAGLETIPALIEEIDDDTALEIAIIENLQREDLTPLDEAAMYDRMVHEHGYSIRKLADKLGKDKGYLENRLRLADAPPEIRELVSLRKDSLSHAYELMKVEDPKKRRRLAEQVARGELTLIKLRDKIEGRRSRPGAADDDVPAEDVAVAQVERTEEDERDELWASADLPPAVEVSDDSLVNAKQSLADAVDGLVGVLSSAELRESIGGHGSGQPREVPDDRQAAPGERDRPGPQRRRGLLTERRPRQPGGRQEPDPDRLELPCAFASGAVGVPAQDHADPDDDARRRGRRASPPPARPGRSAWPRPGRRPRRGGRR